MPTSDSGPAGGPWLSDQGKQQANGKAITKNTLDPPVFKIQGDFFWGRIGASFTDHRWALT